MNSATSTCVAWHASGIENLEDLLTKPFIVGGVGPGTGTDTFPRVFNYLFGAKIKLVTGYPGGNDIDFAMERGEVEGKCSWPWASLKATKPKWLEEGKANVLVQLASEAHPELTERGVPLIMDYTQD